MFVLLIYYNSPPMHEHMLLHLHAQIVKMSTIFFYTQSLSMLLLFRVLLGKKLFFSAEFDQTADLQIMK